MYQSIAIAARAQLGERLFGLSTACEGPDANQGEPTAGSDAAIDLTRKLLGIGADGKSTELHDIATLRRWQIRWLGRFCSAFTLFGQFDT